jgi:hypothetical protein
MYTYDVIGFEFGLVLNLDYFLLLKIPKTSHNFYDPFTVHDLIHGAECCCTGCRPSLILT